MNDALTLLDQVSESITRLTTAVNSVRTKLVQPAIVQPIAREIARVYFESIRTELSLAANREAIVEEIDFVMQTLLQLATLPREKSAYLGQIAEVRPYLQEATIIIMKSRGAPRLVLSQTERSILETLAKMLPTAAASYEQALLDIAQKNRISWRGCASELREVLRETIDYLAPDDKVMQASGFQLEAGKNLPTQKQKVRFILRARKSNSASLAVVEGSLSTMEDSIASLARSTYSRGSVSTHVTGSATEIKNLKRYIDALLAELLEI